MEFERVEEVDGITYGYEPNAITGFIIDGVEVDEGKGFGEEWGRPGIENLNDWNAAAMAQAAKLNQSDPFRCKEQRVKLRTRVKLALRNRSRNRKLGIKNV